MSEHDIGALVIRLEATQPVDTRNHMGRAVQREILRIVDRSNPELADFLHRNTHLPKPYVASGLLNRQAAAFQQPLHPGDTAYIRLCGLDQEVVAALDAFQRHPDEQVSIDRRAFRVQRVTWAGRTAFAQLLDRYINGAEPDHLKMWFLSPTSFRSNGQYLPLPVPYLVFNSLLNRWRSATDLPLPDDLGPFIDHFVRVQQADIQTTSLMFKAPIVGFVGQVTFWIDDHNDKLLKQDPALYHRLKERRRDLACALHLLADFALYGGVGVKTTTGMGLCGLLSSTRKLRQLMEDA